MIRVAALVVCAASGLSLAHEGDYGLLLDGGVVLTGIGDHDAQVINDIGERVFAAEMSLVGSNWFADEPGIFIAANSMPDGVGVGFVLEAALRRWDGTGGVDFSSIPSQAMTLEFGPLSVATAAADGDVAGFSIAYDASSPTGFDEHFDFLLDAATGEGIYLLQMRFTVDGFTDSLSTWTVFNAGLDEELHETAIEYVESTYVPAPGALAMLAAGLVGVRRRR